MTVKRDQTKDMNISDSAFRLSYHLPRLLVS